VQQYNGMDYLQNQIQHKKFLSAEPTGVGKFLISKLLIFNLYPGKYWVKKKVCHTKVVGIGRTFPTIPHMTAFRTVLY